MKQFFEWYFGVPPSDPGQGTAWNYAYRTPWPGWVPPWAVLLLLTAVLAIVTTVYLRNTRGLRTPTRFGLLALRLTALGLVLVFLTELTLSVDRTGLPTLVVLIDHSESMQFTDDYDDETQAAARQYLEAARSAAIANRSTPADESSAAKDHESANTSLPTETRRMTLAKGMLLADDGALLKSLLSRHKLRIYRVADQAIPLGDGAELLKPEDVDRLLPEIAALTPSGVTTRLGPAISSVLDDLRGAPPSAILLFSDGITSTSEGERLSAAIPAARNKFVPIFPIGLGTDVPAQDVQVFGLLADDVAFVGDPVPFTVKVKTFGLTGESIPVRLLRRDTQQVVATTTVLAGEDGVAVPAEFVWTPSEEGEFEFIADVVPRPGESNPNNNTSQPQSVSVRQDPIRVLLVDLAPRYEFRYLKHLLEREAWRSDGKGTLEVRSVLQEADLEYVQSDRTALARFPVRKEELFAYDVIIFGDVDLAFLSPAVVENLRDFVRDAGGGLIMVAGTEHNPLSYRNTLLEDLLPVELVEARVPGAEEDLTQGFQPKLTVEGRQSNAVFRFRETSLDSDAVWKALPPLYWFVETPVVKPGAVVFAEHPFRSGREGNLPLIAVHQFGAGKVWYHASDELWRWRFRRGDREYGRYWLQAIRYLTRTRLLGQDRGARLTADREQYQRGETVTLRVRFLDERLAPPAGGDVTVLLERRGDAQRKVRLTRLAQSPDVYEGQVPRIAEGSYHAWVLEPNFPDGPPAVDFVVESVSLELSNRDMDKEQMLQAARQTGGKFLQIADADRLAEVIPPGQPVPLESQDPVLLWNRWELLLLFALVISAEWFWRKRVRLV